MEGIWVGITQVMMKLLLLFRIQNRYYFTLTFLFSFQDVSYLVLLYSSSH